MATPAARDQPAASASSGGTSRSVRWAPARDGARNGPSRWSPSGAACGPMPGGAPAARAARARSRVAGGDGDDRRQPRGDAPLRQGGRHLPESLGLAPEVDADGAVALEVEEARRHEEAAGVEHVAVGRSDGGAGDATAATRPAEMVTSAHSDAIGPDDASPTIGPAPTGSPTVTAVGRSRRGNPTGAARARRPPGAGAVARRHHDEPPGEVGAVQERRPPGTVGEGGADGVEQGVARLSRSTADGDDGGVEQEAEHRHGVGEPPGHLVAQRSRLGVASGGGGEQAPERRAAAPGHRRPIAAPDATVSRHPRCPHAQRGPSGSTARWPISPAAPLAPRRSRPSSTAPAAMPVPMLR